MKKTASTLSPAPAAGQSRPALDASHIKLRRRVPRMHGTEAVPGPVIMKSFLAAIATCCCLSGCAVITVADMAVGAAVGAVKLTGAAVGAVVDAVTPDSDAKK